MYVHVKDKSNLQRNQIGDIKFGKLYIPKISANIGLVLDKSNLAIDFFYLVLLVMHSE